MSKAKFELTTDLVKIEGEPSAYKEEKTSISPQLKDKIEINAKEQINLKISSKIKKEFKLWCIKNAFHMTDALEMAIKQLIQK